MRISLLDCTAEFVAPVRCRKTSFATQENFQVNALKRKNIKNVLAVTFAVFYDNLKLNFKPQNNFNMLYHPFFFTSFSLSTRFYNCVRYTE